LAQIIVRGRFFNGINISNLKPRRTRRTYRYDKTKLWPEQVIEAAIEVHREFEPAGLESADRRALRV